MLKSVLFRRIFAIVMFSVSALLILTSVMFLLSSRSTLATMPNISANNLTSVQLELLKPFIVSTLLMTLFLLIPVYIFTSRLLKPLYKTMAVAKQMTQGNLNVRADSSPKGELSDLALAVNDMADKLSDSINQLTLERNSLKELFEVMSDGIVSVDLNFTPIYANQALTDYFEKSRLQQNFLEIKPNEAFSLIPFPKIWEDFNISMSKGETIVNQFAFFDKVFRYKIVPSFDHENVVVGAMGFFRDISESERLEQTRKEYVANVSHELRTPLTALRGLIEPLSEGLVKNPEDVQRYYAIILQETVRLSHLINDLLELSRLQTRAVEIDKIPFPINQLLLDTEIKFKVMKKTDDYYFNLELCPGESPIVLGNSDRISEIVIILLDNAIKYTPSGGTITLSTSLSPAKEKLLVSVKDTGVGMKAEDLDHIFERFYTADHSRTSKSTGIGLAIAKELLDYMGEEIVVKSEYGKGSNFIFSISLFKDDPVDYK